MCYVCVYVCFCYAYTVLNKSVCASVYNMWQKIGKDNSVHYPINGSVLLKHHLEMTWLLIETPECHRVKQTYFRDDEKQQLRYFLFALHPGRGSWAGLVKTWVTVLGK